MSISSQEAADALRAAENAANRSSTLYGYQMAAPHFILWGIVWIVGFASTHFFPAKAGISWLVLDIIGLVGSGIIANRKSTDAARRRMTWRYIAVAVTMFVFFTAMFAVMMPTRFEQVTSVTALVVATMYALFGIWRGTRFVVVGATVVILTLVGFFFLKDIFWLWMAFVGGGALILAGIWIRKA